MIKKKYFNSNNINFWNNIGDHFDLQKNTPFISSIFKLLVKIFSHGFCGDTFWIRTLSYGEHFPSLQK